MNRFAIRIAAILAIVQHVVAMRCPPMGAINPNQIGNSCQTSRTCPPRAQCCSTIRGMRCVELVDGSSPSLGVCSDGTAATQNCNPGACPPNYKCENGRCCWNNPYGPPPRPSPGGGRCEDGSTSTLSCSSHAECPAAQKCYGQWCCPDDQSYKRCNDGSTSTMRCPSGVCPVGRACEMGWCCTQSSMGGGRCEDGSFSNKRCTSHNQCRSNEKCYGMWCCPLETETYRQCNDGTVSTTRCPSGICSFGKVCEMGWCCTTSSGNTGTGGTKPGRCPQYLSIPGQLANHQCYSDAECSGSKKCCGTALGRRCLLPGI